MPRRITSAIRIAALLLLPASSWVSVPSSQVQLRSRVEVVVVPVTVKDRSEKLAAGLVQNDFTITEAGKKQTITSFSIDPVPISAAILIDTGISEAALTRVKESFPALMGAFAEDDELVLYRFDKHVEKVLAFTSDRIEIGKALEKLTAATPSTYSMGVVRSLHPGL